MTSNNVQRTSDSSGSDVRCGVVELRQYTLHPGQRDVLIELFDRELVETQEAVGMTVLGQFRDDDDPDRFVWLRGFPGMASRRVSLEAFYGGPVWAMHGHAAAATMIDSDDVLLLRPFRDETRLEPNVGRRPPPGARGDGPGLVVTTVILLDPDHAGEALLGDAIVSALTSTGIRMLGAYETEPAPNTFPRLAVRATDRAFVWFAAYDDERAHLRADEALAADPTWSRTVAPLLHSRLVRQTTRLRLIPTARSRIVGTAVEATGSEGEREGWRSDATTVATQRGDRSQHACVRRAHPTGAAPAASLDGYTARTGHSFPARCIGRREARGPRGFVGGLVSHCAVT